MKPIAKELLTLLAMWLTGAAIIYSLHTFQDQSNFKPLTGQNQTAEIK